MRSAGQVVSAQLGGHVSSSTLSAHQMARAGDASHSYSAGVGAVLRHGWLVLLEQTHP